MITFLQAALARAGAEELVTPREIIRDYLTLLSILHENPNLHFADLLQEKAAVREPVAVNAEEMVSAEKQVRKFEPADLDF